MKDSRNNRKQIKQGTLSPRISFGYPRISLGHLVLLTILLSFLTPFSYKAEAKPSPEIDFSDVWKDRSSSNSYSNSFDFDFDKQDERMDLIVQIVVGLVVFVIVAIFAFILCLCCPICILAKMRSRRRGVVYRSAQTTSNGTTVEVARQRGNTTVTIGLPRAQTTPLQAATSPAPTMIAIPNNANQSGSAKPYPVQQSVTVVPVLPVATHQTAPYPYQPQQPPQYLPQQPPQYPTQMPQAPNKDQYNQELPPPYPGLPREMDSSPYNPYYSETPPASAPTMKQ